MAPPLESIPSLDAAPSAPAPPPTPPSTPTPEPKAPPVAESKPAPPTAAPTERAEAAPDFVPLPDRWSIAYPDSPRIVKGRLIDPYNQNVLKGDKPVAGDHTFLVLTGTLDAPGRAAAPARGQRGLAPRTRTSWSSSATEASSSPPRALPLRRGVSRARPASSPRTGRSRPRAAFNLNYLPPRGAERGRRGRARGQDPLPRGLLARGGLRRGQAQGPLAPLRLRVLAGGHPALRLRLPRPRVLRAATSGRASSATPRATGGSTTRPTSTSWRRRPTASSTTFDQREQKVAMANVFRQDILRPSAIRSPLSYHC